MGSLASRLMVILGEQFQWNDVVQAACCISEVKVWELIMWAYREVALKEKYSGYWELVRSELQED